MARVVEVVATKPPPAKPKKDEGKESPEPPAPGPAWVRLRPESPEPGTAAAATAGAATVAAATATAASSSSSRKPSPQSPGKRPSTAAAMDTSTTSASAAPQLVALPALVAALAERAVGLQAADAAFLAQPSTAPEKEGEETEAGVEAAGAAFLPLGDVLELLSGLAAAFPQAAHALHRTVSARAGPFAAHFLLHTVLPAPRPSPGLPANANGRKGSTDARMRLVRGAQAAARLLVVLCVRSSAARHRLVGALAAALAGSGAATPALEGEALLWALQAWGELTLALLDPRSNPSRPSHHDAGGGAGQTLAWEVVRLMLMPPASGAAAASSSEGLGTMTEALTQAARRVPLGEARAPPALSALLRPLEILTR